MRAAAPPPPRALPAPSHGAAPPQGGVPLRPASTAGATGGAKDARAAERARGVTRALCGMRQRADGRRSEDGGAAAAGAYEWRNGCPLFPSPCPPTSFDSRGPFPPLGLLASLPYGPCTSARASASSCRPGPVATPACTCQVPDVYPSAATTSSAPDTASRRTQRALAHADEYLTS